MFGRKGIEIKKIKCPVCGKMFEAAETQMFKPLPGRPSLVCRECYKLYGVLAEYENRLPKEKDPGKRKRLEEEITKIRKKLQKAIA